MRILYFALGEMTVASSRLRVYKVADALRVMGHIIDIKLSSASVDGYDIIVVQKRQDMSKQMRKWMDQGKIVIFDIDDPTDSFPPYSFLTVGSKQLQQMYPEGIYIADCIDVDESSLLPRKKEHSETLNKVCWFGLACNLYNAEAARQACFKLGLQFTVITDVNGKHEYPKWAEVQYQQWELETVDSLIVENDLVVCPFIPNGKWGPEWIQAKGENRILKAWALGMPVAGTPIDSYLQHGIRHTATTTGQWIDVLERLQSKKQREVDAIIGGGRAKFSSSASIAHIWQEVFKSAIQ